MWEAKVIKAEDIVFEDRVGQHPVKTRFARIVRQPLSGGLGFGILEGEDMAADWYINYDEIFYVLEGNFRCIIDGKVYEGFAGDTIFLPKDTQLRYESTGPVKLLYIVHPEGNVRWRLLVGSD